MSHTTRHLSPSPVHETMHRVRPGLSAELYRKFSERLDVPPESDMPLDIRYEIYLSQVVYLRNLMGQCFESFNRQFDGGTAGFSHHELATIHHSFLVTRDLIRECILKSVALAADKHGRLFCLAADQDWHSRNNNGTPAGSSGEPS